MSVELKVLKNLLANHTLAAEFISSYDEKLFSQHTDIIKQILNYVKAYRTVPTLAVLQERFPDNKEVAKFWAEIHTSNAAPNEFRYHLDLLKKEYTARKVEEIKSKLNNDLGDLDYQIKEWQEELDGLKRINSGKRLAYKQQSLKEYMPEFKTAFNEKRKNPALARGIQTGYSYFDYVTGGLNFQELLIIGAETGLGKSQFLNNLGIQMWLQGNTLDTPTDQLKPGYNTLYFSLEMPYENCARRTLARIADVPIYGIRDAKLNRAQINRLIKADEFIARYPNHFEIVDVARGVSIEALEERYLAACNKFQPHVVVVDYLTLMDNGSEGEQQDWLKLGILAGQLHEFARVYNVVVLTAVQLNRFTKGKDSGEAVSANRIGRSSLILHHANVGLMIEARKNEKTYNDLKVHFLKNRDGAGDSFVLEKKFANGAILDIPYDPEEFTSPEQELGMDDISGIMEQFGWGKK